MGAAAWVRVIVAEVNTGQWTMSIARRRLCGQHCRHSLNRRGQGATRSAGQVARSHAGSTELENR